MKAGVNVSSPYNGGATPATLSSGSSGSGVGTLSPLSPYLIPSPAGSVSSVGSAVSSTAFSAHLCFLPAKTCYCHSKGFKSL